MGIVIGGAIIFAVYLLWRMVRVKEAQAQLEAARLVLEQGQRFEAKFTEAEGTWEQARENGRLIEYIDRLARASGLDADSVRSEIAANELRDLVHESVERGIPCRYLKSSDYDDVLPRSMRYPGPRPVAQMWCTADCDEHSELTYTSQYDEDEEEEGCLPPDATACAFCGAPTKSLYGDLEDASELATWIEEDRIWQLCKKRFPEKAAEEARERVIHERKRAKLRENFEQALATFKAKRR